MQCANEERKMFNGLTLQTIAGLSLAVIIDFDESAGFISGILVRSFSFNRPISNSAHLGFNSWNRPLSVSAARQRHFSGLVLLLDV